MADLPNVEFREFVLIENHKNASLMRLVSPDGTNRLTSACVRAVTSAIGVLRDEARPLVITGSRDFFSVGADLKEISALTSPEAYRFSKMGQQLMDAVATFPSSVIAAIHGHCMGGGLDLVLACSRRIASPDAIFGHQGAALGLITGWGGTQRLPRLVGKGRALELLVAAEKVSARRAIEIGLIDEVAEDPVAASLRSVSS